MSLPPSHVYVAEAPSSIDRSSASAVQSDSDKIESGETLRFKRATFVSSSPEVWVMRVDPNTRRQVGPSTKIGRISPSARWTAGRPGRYEVHTRPTKPDKPKSERPDTKITGYTVESGSGNTGEETVGDPSDWTNTEEPGPDIDPANYRGIVNADNEEGVALAPELRREGASLGPDGATVTLPDGETVDVGAIDEADEVARVLDGPNAGDVIEADQPAVDGDPSSSSGGSGPDSGVIGAVGGGLLLLVAGAAALLFGGD